MPAFKVFYSPAVNEQLLYVYKYVKRRFGVVAAEAFINKVENTVWNISQIPTIGRVSAVNPLIRSVLLTKHNRLYYKIEEDCVFLLTVFDTRQNPDKNKFE